MCLHAIIQLMDKTYLYVQAQLKRRAELKQIAAVSASTKVSIRTLYYIMSGKDVMHGTLIALYDYLKANHRKVDL